MLKIFRKKKIEEPVLEVPKQAILVEEKIEREDDRLVTHPDFEKCTDKEFYFESGGIDYYRLINGSNDLRLTGRYLTLNIIALKHDEWGLTPLDLDVGLESMLQTTNSNKDIQNMKGTLQKLILSLQFKRTIGSPMSLLEQGSVLIFDKSESPYYHREDYGMVKIERWSKDPSVLPFMLAPSVANFKVTKEELEPFILKYLTNARQLGALNKDLISNGLLDTLNGSKKITIESMTNSFEWQTEILNRMGSYAR